jgi:DNA-binding phage protein
LPTQRLRDPARKDFEIEAVTAGSTVNMPTLNLTRWDSADHLNTTEDIAAYLEAAFDDGDSAVINHALGVVARAKGMSEIARRIGI